MSYKKVERYGVDDWRFVAPTVESMIQWRFTVITECRTCKLRLRANLAIVRAIMGPKFTLWGATTPCRRVGCQGRAVFLAGAPGWQGVLHLSDHKPDWGGRERTVVADAARGIETEKPRSRR